MFTGLVQSAGKLRGRLSSGPGTRLEIETDLCGLEVGESVAVNGACLTVAQVSVTRFEVDVSIETAQRSTLGRLPLGSMVNLEPALRIGDRLGGHLVSGHVDAVARIDQVTRLGESVRVRVAHPAHLAPFIAEKGSIALDGVSLTVNGVSAAAFEVMLIPHTRSRTSLANPTMGQEVNLEVDLLARYVARALGTAGTSGDEPLVQALRRAGMLG
jgi:riboflavin synthase